MELARRRLELGMTLALMRLRAGWSLSRLKERQAVSIELQLECSECEVLVKGRESTRLFSSRYVHLGALPTRCNRAAPFLLSYNSPTKLTD